MDDIYLLSVRACTELAESEGEVPMQMTLLLQEHTNYVSMQFLLERSL